MSSATFLDLSEEGGTYYCATYTQRGSEKRVYLCADSLGEAELRLRYAYRLSDRIKIKMSIIGDFSELQQRMLEEEIKYE